MKLLTHGLRSLVLGAFMAGTASASYAADPMVGGAPMSASKTVVENASAAKNLTTLVAAVKAAGLVETLSGPGPFTVFAPTMDGKASGPAGLLSFSFAFYNLDRLESRNGLADQVPQ